MDQLTGIRRLLTGVWFGGLGLCCSGALFLVPSLERGTFAILMYVGLPALAAAVAGCHSGINILDPEKTKSYWQAAGWGLLVTLEAFLLFAPTFSALYVVSDADRTQLLGLTLAVFMIGVLATGPLILPVGLMGGVILHAFSGWVRRY